MGRRREQLASFVARATLCLGVVAMLGCKTEAAQPSPPPESTATTTGAKKVDMKAAPAGDVANLVVAEVARAKAAGRKVIVYVGASWCEPCRNFHHAAEKGELDTVLADVTFIEFDADRDSERLAKAGYTSTYIPLFVVPDASGKASAKRVEGGIKGDGAVAFLTKKIRAIL